MTSVIRYALERLARDAIFVDGEIRDKAQKILDAKEITVYRAYQDSNHKIVYVLGHSFSKEMAENFVKGFPQSAGSPPAGVSEIKVPL